MKFEALLYFMAALIAISGVASVIVAVVVGVIRAMLSSKNLDTLK